jgi:hypothetical protein
MIISYTVTRYTKPGVPTFRSNLNLLTLENWENSGTVGHKAALRRTQ